jgi:hypothetical protein
MGAPSANLTAPSPVGPADVAVGAVPSPADDLLAGFGPILAAVAQRDDNAAEVSADRFDAGRKFSDDFATACAREVRPAMDAVVERLRQLGGDGLVEEHPGGEARFRSPRLALWMSLKGEIVDEPRLDRYPYLLFEADVEARKVQVDEGDMWRGAGGNTSRRVGAWDVSELTRQRVTEALLEIARRAAH